MSNVLIASHLLATGDTRGTLRLWDPATGGAVRVLGRHRGAVYSVRFSPDGSTLATADSDGVVRLWDTGAQQLRHELTGHRPAPARRTGTGQLAVLLVAVDPGGARLWGAFADGLRALGYVDGRNIRIEHLSSGGGTSFASAHGRSAPA